jgi:tetratricopeptide (TPR) repeat protein
MSSVGVSHKPEVLSQADSSLFAALTKRPIVLGLILIVATVALYYPVHGHPFANFDDNDYVYDNPHVQSGISLSTVKWAFTTSFAANWHPLTWLSHALDCDLFGTSPAGPHDVNVLLHALNAVLLFWVLLRATGYAGRSFMVAALFALHPLNVESVAWIAERKTMLSTVFFLLALGAYRRYARQPGVGRYSVVCLLFALGLMAKPQIILLPFVLLLWDYWPLERISFPFNKRYAEEPLRAVVPAKTLSWLVLEKVPLFVIAAASAAITIKAQHGARSWFPRTSRVGNAILSYALYLKRTFWPTRLALLYPHPGASIGWWHVAVAALVLLAITALVIAGRRYRYLSVGWCWFLGMLVPMLGIVQVGIQGMADRYAYLSVLGIFIMVCWGMADWAGQKRLPANLLPGVSTMILLALALVARHQINYWSNNEVLWSHTLQVTDANWLAEDELGGLLAMQGRVREAMPHFYKAIALNPTDSTSNMALGIYQLRRGDFASALDHYRIVVKDEKGKPTVLREAYLGMAKAYRAIGDTVEEQECLDAAKRFDK